MTHVNKANHMPWLPYSLPCSANPHVKIQTNTQTRVQTPKNTSNTDSHAGEMLNKTRRFPFSNQASNVVVMHRREKKMRIKREREKINASQ
jgi:NAD kinase